jgi:hypothetical protein
MGEVDELLRLSVLQLKAGRATHARLLAAAAKELGDSRSEALLSVIAGMLSESWPSEPHNFESTCSAIGLPVIEARAYLNKALTLGQATPNSARATLLNARQIELN